MRIFLVLEAAATNGYAQGKIWLRNLHDPLVDLGHEVILFPAQDGWKAMQLHNDGLRADFSQRLLTSFRLAHAQKPVDLLFTYLMDGMIDCGAIDEIHKAGVPTCNFSCNNAHQFYLVDDISRHFDYNLHSEKDTAEKFTGVGANAIWFPMAANSTYYRPCEVERCLDVSFVGQCYARRPYYVWHLLENGVDVHAYGPSWRHKQNKRMLRQSVRWLRRAALAVKAVTSTKIEKRHELSARLADMDLRDHLCSRYPTHIHGPVSDDEMVRKYSESKISLGFLEVYDLHNPAAAVKQHIHLREFEAPMSGALYFTGWCEELEEFYEPDKEIIVYRNEHELLDKVLFYLSSA